MKRMTTFALLALLAFGGCSTPTPTSTPTQVAEEPTAAPEPVESDAPEPRNPVDLLKQLGDPDCKTQAEAGEVDVNGNWYASCKWMDNSGTGGTELTVRTYPGDPLELDPNPRPFRSSDSNRFIIGSDFVAMITGDWTAYSKRFTKERLTAIADKLGGEYLPPGEKRG